MFLIVGLGNPGPKLQKTRHNVGFLALDVLLKEKGFSTFKFSEKLEAEISEGTINSQKIVLAKPQTFMNNSGKSVKKLLKNKKIKADSVFVIHDDLDLPLGQIKISKNRGSAGHKVVQSIIDELRTKDFARLRLGIKTLEKNKNVPAEKLVLQKFTKEEEKDLKEVFNNAVLAIELIISEGSERAMNKCNKQ